MVRVLVADDHAIVRAGLVTVLEMEAGLRVVGQAATGEQAIELYRQLRPDVVTMDLRMPGLDGTSATAALCTEFPDARVLVLTSLGGDEQIYRALAAGALGYLFKDASSPALIAAVRRVAQARRSIGAEVDSILSARNMFEPLSARELEVLRAIAAGHSNREAGQQLGLTENTVKTYLKIIAGKLGTTDRTAAAILGLKRGLLHLDDIE